MLVVGKFLYIDLQQTTLMPIPFISDDVLNSGERIRDFLLGAELR